MKFRILNILRSSGLQHHVVPLVVTNVSEEPAVSMLGVEITSIRSHNPEKCNFRFNLHTNIKFRLGIEGLD
jgi:hypothetical protein